MHRHGDLSTAASDVLPAGASEECCGNLQPDPLATNPEFEPVMIAPVIAELGAAPKCACFRLPEVLFVDLDQIKRMLASKLDGDDTSMS